MFHGFDLYPFDWNVNDNRTKSTHGPDSSYHWSETRSGLGLRSAPGPGPGPD